MENLTVKKESLHKAWTASDASGRKALESLFGAGNMPQPITYRVTTFQEACDILGTSPETELPYPSPSSSRQRGVNAFAKVAIIAEALNEGWKPDWTDPNQYKYYPYFTNTGSGFPARLAVTGTRIRTSARAFATKARSWPSTPGNTLRTSITICSIFKNSYHANL